MAKQNKQKSNSHPQSGEDKGAKARMAGAPNASGKRTHAPSQSSPTQMTAAASKSQRMAERMVEQGQHRLAGAPNASGGKRSQSSPTHKTTTASESRRMAERMVEQGQQRKCPMSNRTSLIHNAQIFPKCWIEDGSYANKTKKSGDVCLRDYVSETGSELRYLLNGPRNRIFISVNVHVAFDHIPIGRDGRLGAFTLVPQGGDQYRIRVRDEFLGDPELAMDGIVHDRIVQIMGIDHRLLQWHNARFEKRLPTAGAEVRSSDDDDEDRHDPEEDARLARVAAARVRAFVREQRKLQRVSARKEQVDLFALEP